MNNLYIHKTIQEFYTDKRNKEYFNSLTSSGSNVNISIEKFSEKDSHPIIIKIIDSIDSIILDFNYLKSARKLIVRNCTIKTIISLNENSSSSLEEIIIFNSQVNNFKLKNLSQLRLLSLTYNEISSLFLKNMERLDSLDISNNSISNLKDLYSLPNLAYINVLDNPLSKIECIRHLPQLKKIEGMELTPFPDCFRAKTNNAGEDHLYSGDYYYSGELKELRESCGSVGFAFEWYHHDDDFNESDDFVGFSHFNIIKVFEFLDEFRVNEVLVLRLVEDIIMEEEIKEANLGVRQNKKSIIFVDGKHFMQCKYLLVNISEEEITKYDDFESIDEIKSYYLGNSEIEKVFIDPYTEFWGHCSNLQAWFENEYNTRLLDMRLAFPLLKRLTEVGDPVARKVFKEEIALRYSSGIPSVVE